MSKEHPNVLLMRRLDLRDLSGCADLFSPDFVWHYINPKLPEIEGDYVGASGLIDFFDIMSKETSGNFRIEPVSATAFGNELLVTHVRNSLSIKGQSITIDAIVVWRIVNGLISEAWDIPSAHTLAKEGNS